MKKIRFLFYLLICSISTISCGQFLEPTEYHFDNFKNTPVEKIAMAARANNSKLILELARKNESEIDFKDPKFNMTLLAVAIANKKDKAINALLSINANPNILVGNDSEYTPFSMAINYNEDCTTLLIEKMLHHNANPNLEINTPNDWLDKKIPLFEAIQKRKAIRISNLVYMKQLHVIKIIHGYPLNYNAGSEVYSQSICEELSKQHKVSVFTREENPYSPDFAIRHENASDNLNFYFTVIPQVSPPLL